MKKHLALLSIIVLTVAFIATALTCIRPPAGHCDFSFRYNEVSCLRLGVNPFSVWHEDIILPPYCSNAPKKPIPPGCTQPVNAYTPWTYSLMLPFSYLPQPLSWTIYCALMGAFEILLFLIAYRTQSENTSKVDRVLISSISLVCVSYLLWSNASVGNFAIWMLAASVMMAVFLSRQKNILAGIFWALAMVKPQSAILFAVPLLLKKRLSTCIVAAGICLGLSVIPMIMCHTDLLTLLQQGPAANAEFFAGCGTYPHFLLGTFDTNVEIIVGLSLGLGLCCLMTWMLRHEDDWFILLMPAAVCAASWTYTQAYSHAMCWFLIFVLVRELLARPRSLFLWCLFALAVFSTSRWFLAWHGISSFTGQRFALSEIAFHNIDTLNSTLTLLIALLFCIWKKGVRHPHCNRNANNDTL